MRLSSERWLAKLLTFAGFAESLAQHSTCKRASVGTIVFPSDMGRVVSIGYNGPPRGLPNDSCEALEGSCGCVHAEANAIVKLDCVHECRLIMLSTVSPCFSCAGLIINTGAIDAVIFKNEYRRDDGIRRLKAARILVERIGDMACWSSITLESWLSDLRNYRA